MTRWDERFENHPVFAKLDELTTSLAGAKNTQQKHHPKDQSVVEGLERAESLLAWIHDQLKGAEPSLTAEATLKGILGNANHANNEAVAYTNDRNPGHIDNLNNHLENCVPSCSQLPRPQTPEAIASLTESASSYRRSMGQLAANLAKDVEKNESASRELEERLQGTKAEIEQQKARLDQAISRFDEQASAAQESQRKEADQTIEDLRQKFREASEVQAKAHEDRLATVAAAEEQALERLQGLKDKAQKLVDAVGSAGMSGGYQKVANKLRKEAYVWQTLAVIALVGLVATQIRYIPSLAEGYDPWQTIALRTVFAAGFVLLAGYCATQSRRAHRLEEWNRKLELQLASLGPFVADLPQDVQEQLRRDIALKFFEGPGASDERRDAK